MHTRPAARSALMTLCLHTIRAVLGISLFQIELAQKTSKAGHLCLQVYGKADTLSLRAGGIGIKGVAITHRGAREIQQGRRPPVHARCFSVMDLIAAATAVSGTMGGPYSSESSSCRRQRGFSALGSCTIITMRGLHGMSLIISARTLNKQGSTKQCEDVAHTPLNPPPAGDSRGPTHWIMHNHHDEGPARGPSLGA